MRAIKAASILITIAWVIGTYFYIPTSILAQGVEIIVQQHPEKIPLLIKVRLEYDGEQWGRQLEWVGSKGKSQRMLGLSVSLKHQIPGVQLQYMAHIEKLGDTQWVNSGTFLSGSEPNQTRIAGIPVGGNPGARIEGIAFRMIGELEDQYDIWYQAHLEGIGDTQWYKNGDFCGTRGQSRRLEAFVVAVTKK